MSHKKEIFKCHHQAPLWNQSFVIYCVPSGTCNSSCSAGLEYFQLGCPAERHITSPCQFESFSVEMLEVEEEFSFLSGCHPMSSRIMAQQKTTARSKGNRSHQPLPARHQDLGTRVCLQVARCPNPHPLPLGTVGICLNICELKKPKQVQPVGWGARL